MYIENGKIKDFEAFRPQEIRPELNWKEFLENWKKTTIVGDLLSLLHRGFDIPAWEPTEAIDRLAFYLMQADGWRDLFFFDFLGKEKYYVFGYDQNNQEIKRSSTELRRQVAEKAFNMLSLRFFKNLKFKNLREDSNTWLEKIIFSEELFPVIQHFFRIEGGKVRNLHPSKDFRNHNEKMAIDFLENLTQIIWHRDSDEFQGEITPEQELFRQFIRQTAKPWTVEILAALNRLDVLHPWLFELGKPTLEKLEEIALQSKLTKYSSPVTEDRLVNSIEEAFFLDSPAARFLIEYWTKKDVRKKLMKIFFTEQAIKKLQNRVNGA